MSRTYFSAKVLQILTAPVKREDEIVDRLISFLTLFALDVASSNRDFFYYFLDYLLNLVGVQLKDPRVRSCQLIAAILTGLRKGESDFVLEYGLGVLFVTFRENAEKRLLTALAERLTDKLVSVRLSSVKALASFYHSEACHEGTEELVLEFYLHLLANDASPYGGDGPF